MYFQHKDHNIISIMSLDHESQSFDLMSMLGSGGHDIDSRRIDTAMAQNVRKLGNILLNAVKRARKEFTQIVWENFLGINLCSNTQLLHICPDVTSIYRTSCACAEKDSVGDTLLLCVA